MFNPLNIGIVTTVAGAAAHIRFFLDWHFSIGFHHIFIFVDDNCVDTYNLAQEFDNVTAILRDTYLKEHWRDLPPYLDSYKRETINSEVMTRQEFNVYHATIKAKMMGMDWLVHLDIDELFYPNNTDLQNHFKLLNADNVGSFIYQNYEAIQTRSDQNNIYQSTCYFKINYFRRGSLVYSKKQREFLSSSGCSDGFYFNYYQNGKSAFNISDAIKVHDVHYIRNVNKNTRFGKNNDPLVLHYPCANYEEFRNKYQTLGDFPNNWNNKPRAGKFINTFHLKARDTWLSGNESEFESLYERKMLYKTDLVRQLIKNELAIKIDDICIFQPNCGSHSGNKPGPQKFIGLNDNLSKIEKKNILALDRSSKHLDTLPNECFIHFNSEKEAAKWIRRHPVYKNDPNVIVYRDKKIYYLYWGNSRLLDFDHFLTVESIKSVLDCSVEAEFVLVNVANLVDFLSGNNTRTAHQFGVGQIERFVTMHKSLEPERSASILIEAPEDLRSFLTLIPGVKIINRNIIKVVNEAIASENPKLFINYIKSVYPPNRYVTIIIDITSVMGLSYRSSIYAEILLFLGGAIIYDASIRKYCPQGLNFRDNNPSIANFYASVKDITKEGKLLVLEKEIGSLKYYMLCNISCDTLSFKTAEIDIENKVVTNMIENKKHIFGKLLELQPLSFFIIKAKM